MVEFSLVDCLPLEITWVRIVHLTSLLYYAKGLFKVGVFGRSSERLVYNVTCFLFLTPPPLVPFFLFSLQRIFFSPVCVSPFFLNKFFVYQNKFGG